VRQWKLHHLELGPKKKKILVGESGLVGTQPIGPGQEYVAQQAPWLVPFLSQRKGLVPCV